MKNKTKNIKLNYKAIKTPFGFVSIINFVRFIE